MTQETAFAKSAILGGKVYFAAFGKCIMVIKLLVFCCVCL